MGIALALTALWLVAATGAAAQRASSPPEVPPVAGVAVSDRTIECGGQSFTVTGIGWVPEEPVRVSFVGERIATAVPGPQGRFSTAATAPEALRGEHTLRATQGDLQASAMATCVPEEQVEPARAGVVAFTGANITVGLLILLGLLAATGATLAFGRRQT